MQRIVVLGVSASGKTTLAQNLSAILGYPHIELDALHWEADWKEAEDSVMQSRASAAIQEKHWIADGNYRSVREIIWPEADTFIWLDYPLYVILARLTFRTLSRVFLRQTLWNGNKERFKNQFFSRNSLYVWVFQTYWRRKKEYPAMFQTPEYATKYIIRFKSPRECAVWLKRLKDTHAAE